MALIAKPIYRRGQLIRISVEESVRLGVPKDRPWLVIQSNDVKDSLEVVVCYLSKVVDEKGKKKPKRKTDVLIRKGLNLYNKRTLQEDSYIRCGKIYSAGASQIEAYVGTLPKVWMILVDKTLRECLDLPFDSE